MARISRVLAGGVGHRPLKSTMPDLANPSSLSRTLPPTDVLLPNGKRVGLRALDEVKENGAAVSRKGEKSLEDYVKEWEIRRRVVAASNGANCVSSSASALPFLVGAKRMVQCRICHHFLSLEEGLHCIVRGCRGIYHSICVKEQLGISTFKSFKCPQHVCFLCKQRPHWRCVLCSMASHHNCAAWPDKVVHLKNRLGQAVCWKHLKVNVFFASSVNLSIEGWLTRLNLLNEQHDTTSSCIEEIFRHLPLPFDKEEFKFDITLKDAENKLKPPAYIHIRRNIYLVKKKRDHIDDGVGCSNCGSMCSENCVCRVQCISCSKTCRCPENCMNRPFRKERKIKVVKTELCGWGVEAAESINKGEFVIEYIGEVISDALCEQRLWDMKFRGLRNFYMCEVRKDFTIDATFKGNFSRFLNHSCNPNCFLEKWQVEGETRVGVFAARLIKVGEPLTYDYRFVQFGPEVKCHCGARNCQGYLGLRKRVAKLDIHWGSKRKRTTAASVAMVTL